MALLLPLNHPLTSHLPTRLFLLLKIVTWHWWGGERWPDWWFSDFHPILFSAKFRRPHISCQWTWRAQPHDENDNEDILWERWQKYKIQMVIFFPWWMNAQTRRLSEKNCPTVTLKKSPYQSWIHLELSTSLSSVLSVSTSKSPIILSQLSDKIAMWIISS